MNITRTALFVIAAAATLSAGPLLGQEIVAMAAAPTVAPNTSVTSASELNFSSLLGLKRDQIAVRYPMLSTAELDELMFRIADARSMVRTPPTDH